jgi:cyanate lyase
MSARTRDQVTDAILAAKRTKNLTWADIAQVVGRSKEWTTAACLGQMSLKATQTTALAELLDLDESESALLLEPPYRGSLPTAIPTDPLIYRFYELVNVYGTTLKALIQDEFGDGIMSAIDFSMAVEREPDPAGDRVNITLSGKFLPYKQY